MNMREVEAVVETLVIPTYPEPPKEELPMFSENRVHQRSSGRPYPQKVVMEVDRSRKIDREYTVIRMENEYLSLYILPEIGGRIYAARDKSTGYDFFYKQHVIKPALIGVLGSWMSGGVEFNWPFHHRASGFMPCDFEVERLPDGGAVCWLSEHDPIDRMKGMVGVVLKPGEAIFETRMRLYNRTETPRSFLWWENAAVPVNEQYRIFFPPDVTYVNFHYLKSRADYPIAGNTVFNGIDMKEPVDISWHKNTRQATSYFASASKYDFFGGYDYAKECGVVHIGNHHLSPGKKMFTWAYCQLAKSWENALTDTDGQYAELMAGSYSDNQPDFAWLQPYETKCFSQYWYPISKIKTPCFANLNGAVSLERGAGGGVLRVQSVKRFEGAVITVSDGEKTVFSTEADLIPCQPLAFEINPLPEQVEIKVTQSGRSLISYREETPDRFHTPDPIEDTPSAERLDSVQELYLAGVHVEQYRDPAVYPDAYWLEALRRDPKHIPSLIAMARYRYRLYDYAGARAYITRAIGLLTRFNAHPQSGEAYYLQGLILEAEGERAAAYDAYYKAAWCGLDYDKAMTRISLLDLYQGDAEKALEHAENALSRNTRNGLAQAAQMIACRKIGETERANRLLKAALAEDRLNHLLRFLQIETTGAAAFFAPMHSAPAQTCLDLAFDLADMGQTAKAVFLLEQLVTHRPDQAIAMVFYTLAYLKRQIGEDDTKALSAAEAAEIGDAFPLRPGELKALLSAPPSSRTKELAGNLFYAKRNIDAARACFEEALRLNPENPTVMRNLAVLYFNYDHAVSADRALELMRRAVALRPDSKELVYETVVLMDKLAKPPKEKIAFLREHAAQTDRDDIQTELAKAYNQAGEPDAALSVLKKRQFVPCEGGEHAIADQYLFAYFQKGYAQLAAGNAAAALELFRTAQVLPQNLGAGIWNHCKLIPCRYFEAVALQRLGKTEDAEKLYRYITETKIDYFSNMFLKELPFYQALSYDRLGEHLKGVHLMTTYRRVWEDALGQTDSGYFGTTPFFIPFTDSPSAMRRAQYSYLCGLCEDYMGHAARAAELWNLAAGLNSELQFAAFYAEKGILAE